MKDAVSQALIYSLHPKVMDDFKAFIEDAETGINTTIRIVQALRTFAEQDELYTHGRTKMHDEKGVKLGIVTNSKAGQSYHNYGLAVDLVELKNGVCNWNFNYNLLENYSKKYALAWGGNFHSILDRPHFEKTFGINWRQLLEKYNAKDFIENTTYIKI